MQNHFPVELPTIRCGTLHFWSLIFRKINCAQNCTLHKVEPNNRKHTICLLLVAAQHATHKTMSADRTPRKFLDRSISAKCFA